MQYLTYDLDKRNKQSLQCYLYTCIRNDILLGHIQAKEKLPSKRKLAQHLGVATITVAAAYEHLEQEGYIEAKPRQGYYTRELSPTIQAKLNALKAQKPTLGARELSAFDEATFDPDIIDLSSNRTGTETFPLKVWADLTRKVLAKSPDELMQEGSAEGMLELREAIARHLRRFRGIRVSPKNIIIGAGTEYLYSALLSILPKSKIAFEDPGYKKFSDIAAAQGHTVLPIPLDMQGMQIDKLKESLATLVHVSPQGAFPAGVALSQVRQDDLLAWLNESADRYIIEDDFDSELSFSTQALKPCMVRDTGHHTIYLNTFSKTIMPLLRVGYMVLPDELLALWRARFGSFVNVVSKLEQMTLAAYIKEGHFERHVHYLQNYYELQREIVMRAIRGSKLKRVTTIHQNSAGTHFLLRVTSGMSAIEIKKRAKACHLDIHLLSEYSYGASQEAQVSLVINFASLARSDIQKSVAALCTVLYV